MNLFEGLEKLGLIKVEEVDNLFEDEKKKSVKSKAEEVPDEPLTEESFLLEKNVRCAICDKMFKTSIVKNGRVRRLESDEDLRPRYQYIDTIKYDVTSCPFCGYTAMNRYFDHLAPVQIRLIRENVCKNFNPSGIVTTEIVDYDTAIGRYKLSLYNTVVKRGKVSEKAFTCLKIAWLYRGKAETLEGKDTATEIARRKCKEQEDIYYRQAYDGFMKAVSSESFPLCGMDTNTVDYLLAYMAAHFKEYDVASKCISNIITSSTAQAKTKDRARDLKDKIVAELKSGK